MRRAEGLLEWTQSVGRREALDGRDGGAVELHGEQQAAPSAGSVDEDAVLAAHVRAGEPEILPEKVGQGLAHRHLALDGATVDGEPDHAARGGGGQGHD